MFDAAATTLYRVKRTEVERLPDEDKQVVKTLLDAFLTKKHLQSLVR
jgi:hypothetical protein